MKNNTEFEIAGIQGDVMLVRCESIPEAGMREVKDGTLALGEHTGHSHRIFGATVLEAEDGTLYVNDVQKNALLRHVKENMQQADHLPIVLEEGATYEVVLQKKYNPWAKVWDRVID